MFEGGYMVPATLYRYLDSLAYVHRRVGIVGRVIVALNRVAGRGGEVDLMKNQSFIVTNQSTFMILSPMGC